MPWLLPVALILGCARVDSSSAARVTKRTDLLNYSKPLPDLLPARSSISLFIEKRKYRLTVRANANDVKSYPVVFGRNPVDDKLREGDGCTPEGRFRIDARYGHRDWNRFMRIDYPTAESWRRFRQAIRSGRLRPSATIGGFIGIHGVPEGRDSAIEERVNWTLGCISLKNPDVEELYEVVRIGTPVEIVH
jgi:murein L,D-transpeptidase YafK